MPELIFIGDVGRREFAEEIAARVGAQVEAGLLTWPQAVARVVLATLEHHHVDEELEPTLMAAYCQEFGVPYVPAPDGD